MNEELEHRLRRARLTPPPQSLDARMEALFSAAAQRAGNAEGVAHRHGRRKALLFAAAAVLLVAVGMGWHVALAPEREAEIPVAEPVRHIVVYQYAGGAGRNQFDFSAPEPDSEMRALYTVEWRHTERAGHAF